MRSVLRCCVAYWSGLLLIVSTAAAGAATYREVVFGPEIASRGNGKEEIFSFSIPVRYPLEYSRYYLSVENPDPDLPHPVKARIWLNDDVAPEPWVVWDSVHGMLKVRPGQNTLYVELLGKPGDSLTVSARVVVEDDELPAIDARVTPPSNDAGWHNTSPVVSFSCSDAITGIAFCSEPVHVPEGAGQLISGTARDKAGNEVTTSVTLNVDVTAPQATAEFSPALNPAGWQNQAVTATFSCIDNLSDVALCPGPLTFSQEGRAQQRSATVSDRAGNSAEVMAAASLDFTPPVISIGAAPPANAAGWHDIPPTISYSCSDALSGVAVCPPSITLSDEGAGIAVLGIASDLASNTSSAETTINLDLTPPAITLVSPAATTLLPSRTPTFVFSVDDLAPDFGAASLTYGDATISATCAGEGHSLTCTSNEALGVTPRDLKLTIPDLAGHVGMFVAPLSFDVDGDAVADHIDQCLESRVGEEVDETGCAADQDVDGDGVPDSVDQCLATNPGAVVSEDGCDDSQRDSDGDGVVDIEDPLPQDPDRSTLPIVTISSPQTLATFGMSPITVTGTVDTSAVNFTVNGAVVPFDTQGNWTTQVHLDEGHNTVVARMVDDSGIVSTATISLSLDLTPPYLTVESHTDGQVVRSQPVAIAGLINDIVRGTIEAEQAMVTVNDIEAEIVNRSYLADGIVLQEGENLITIRGSDQAGNLAEETLTLIYQSPGGKRLELVSGQAQSGLIERVLPEPLVVKVLDDSGAPVVDKPVVFRVIQGAGLVAADTPLEARGAVVKTDAGGLASTRFKLGLRSGTGNHKVRARVVGYEDEVVFHASAEANIGDKLSVNSGNNQRGSVFRPLPAPFVVVVTDNGANVVPGARVEFKVTQGNGKFENGETSILKVTDSDGRASAHYTAGGQAGLDTQRITATLLDGPEGQTITAGFTVSAFVPGDPGQTSISGLVVDNQNQPLPGVTVRVDGTSRKAVSDAEGLFRIDNVPVGPVHLIADGSTVEVEGEYPSLAYNLVTVSGVDNPLPAPIYMVKLNTENAVWAGPEDAALTLPEVPGFKLEIPAGSVTFPDGSREGYVSVTVVNTDTIPMTPPNGMQPQFIVTIQPTNALFDPPARLSLPNVDGHLPGRQVEMFSFDHDLEEFVAIGLGTVSEDGTEIRSNPGVGVVRAGWHCGAQPGGSGCCQGGEPPECAYCEELKGSCPGTCEVVPERPAEEQTPNNCQRELCQGSEDDPGDKTECQICVSQGEEGPLGPENAPDGGSCDDKNKCTYDDQCKDGGCAGTPITDPGFDPCFACENGQEKPGPAGGSCDDSNACTTGDTCNGAGGCVGTPVADGTVPQACKKCAGGSPVADASQNGQECAAGKVCFYGQCVPDENPCEGYSDACTICTVVNGQAQISSIQPPPPGCDPCQGKINECQICTVQNGVAVVTPRADRPASCEDSDARVTMEVVEYVDANGRVWPADTNTDPTGDARSPQRRRYLEIKTSDQSPFIIQSIVKQRLPSSGYGYYVDIDDQVDNGSGKRGCRCEYNVSDMVCLNGVQASSERSRNCRGTTGPSASDSGVPSGDDGVYGEDGTFYYDLPDYAGEYELAVKVSLADGSIVELPKIIFTNRSRLQLEALAPSLSSNPNAQLVGQTPAHTENHWGVPALGTAVSTIATGLSNYLGKISGLEPLRVNDMALPHGGRFEIDADWSKSSHHEHAVGLTGDVGVQQHWDMRRECTLDSSLECWTGEALSYWWAIQDLAIGIGACYKNEWGRQLLTEAYLANPTASDIVVDPKVHVHLRVGHNGLCRDDPLPVWE